MSTPPPGSTAEGGRPPAQTEVGPPTASLSARPTERLRARLRSGGACPRCGYSLKEHTGVRCPECGFVLAAELLDAGDPARIHYGLWAQRAMGVAAVFTSIAVVGRAVLAALNQTPRPSLGALIPLAFTVTAWVMLELVRAYVEAARRADRLALLLGVISAGSLLVAWRMW